MKKLILIALTLTSYSTFAETYRWECTTLNFLTGNIENASSKSTYELDSNSRKEIILSQNSSVTIALYQTYLGVDIKAYDTETKQSLGAAGVTIGDRTLVLYPADNGKGFSWVNCHNLDILKVTNHPDELRRTVKENQHDTENTSTQTNQN